MSTCARCGHRPDGDGKDCNSDASARLHCRDRELANLHSLLRSVTGKLEEAAEILTEGGGSVAAECRALPLIHQVLEVLS